MQTFLQKTGEDKKQNNHRSKESAHACKPDKNEQLILRIHAKLSFLITWQYDRMLRIEMTQITVGPQVIS